MQNKRSQTTGEMAWGLHSKLLELKRSIVSVLVSIIIIIIGKRWSVWFGFGTLYDQSPKQNVHNVGTERAQIELDVGL